MSPVVTSIEDRLQAAGDGPPSSLPQRQAEQQEEKQFEDGYEVMNSIGPRGGEAPSSESPKSSIVILKEPGSPALGGTVNLILSFGGQGDSQVQVLENTPARTEEVVEETSEPVHRVRNTHCHQSALWEDPVIGYIHLSPCMGSPSCCCSFLSPPLAFTSSFFPLSLLPVKPFGGAARGFWKILLVV